MNTESMLSEINTKESINLITKPLNLKSQYHSQKRLKCIAVDDDPFMLEILKDLCDDSSVEMVAKYTCPKQFLVQAGKVDYDFCLLDVFMPEISGVLLAQLLKGKPVIFVTGNFDNLKDVVDVGPIDIISKPVNPDRFKKAIDKAYKLIYNNSIPWKNKEYELFNIAESNEKVKIFSSDIFFVRVDEIDARNKKLITKTGDEYTLMDCTFERLINLSSRLIQVNKAELVSLDAIHRIKHDLITLVKMGASSVFRQVTLSYTYRKSVLSHF